MKRSISTPVAIVIVVVVVAALAAAVWHKASETGSTADVSAVAKEIQSKRTDLPIIPKEEILKHAAGGRPGPGSVR